MYAIDRCGILWATNILSPLGSILVLRRLCMRWHRKDMWKACIAIAGILLLLVLMIWIPASEAGAYEGAPGVAATVTDQTTPTVDATVSALNKEKLAQEVQQL